MPKSKTIAVFSMTDGGIAPEIEDIAFTVKSVVKQGQRPRLITLGRGSKRAEETLRQKLAGMSVEFVALGLLSPGEVSKTLAASDVLLFTRGSLSTQRGSAIAGIACGLPIVAYSNSKERPPLSEAGILFVPQGDKAGFSEAVARVLTDSQLWEELHRLSLRAQEKYFSWDVIADKFLKILPHGSTYISRAIGLLSSGAICRANISIDGSTSEARHPSCVLQPARSRAGRRPGIRRGNQVG